jgi:class 3 adenylate cyclase
MLLQLVPVYPQVGYLPMKLHSSLADFVRELGHFDASADEEAAFRRHCQELSGRGIQLLALFLLGANLFCWPTDRWLFPNDPQKLHTFILWRIALTTCLVSVMALMHFDRFRRSQMILNCLILIVFITAGCGGYWMSQYGGMDHPFFYGVYTTAGVWTALFVPLFPRTCLSHGLSLCFLMGFFGRHPAYWHHPLLISVLEVIVAANSFYILLGHIIYLLTRKSFLQGLDLQRKAGQLAVANEKSERLLLNILPAPIAARLKEEQRSIADGFPEVTVLFADIVGFTLLAANMSPQDLVQLLNSVFSDFDHEVERLGLEKVKTIGDAYMVAGGLPVPRSDHVVSIAELALSMRNIIARYRGPGGTPLRLRIGIHTGPVVAGVIGWKKFIYDLWGDTVNTASRMESHGIPDEIQVSDAVRRRLESSFALTPRGPIDVKGIGLMSTWFLKGPLEGPEARLGPDGPQSASLPPQDPHAEGHGP